ncbi:MAG: Type 1 glutamine amidotransferase-like domain-containing protein [Clostridia bacterium]|nr:Type 1 glutamine amidotransferase-like domain-containing protein [Clostridia bacterium]
MAKLLLSSCDFRNAESAKSIYENLPFPIQDCRVLYFPNEKATEADIISEKFYNRLSHFGFNRQNIHVFNYYSPADFDINSKIDVIYISGGNTFGTLKRIRESDADKIIMHYVSKGAVYVGGSAGAHIASRSIAHVSKYDVDTYGLTDFSGLHLFDGLLICHYTDARKDDYLKLIEQGKRNVVMLRDQDCLVIE